MSLQLYDTLSASKRPFVPRRPGEVGLYVCGITVYDYCHVGHARVMVGFDMMVRWLRACGFAVNYVRNITDIDDKIIRRAAENGESIGDLTARFIDAMHEDLVRLGCLPPTSEPRATEHIDAMQTLIATLIDKKLAYQGTSGDVYYAVDKFAEYGKLSKRKLADMLAGARIESASDKRHPFDFVLWKAADPKKSADPHWPSPWGDGRPGWHIECSAMSMGCLGEHFDIHGGGHDLQFPHHENEIAQSEGATGKPYANYWVHMGFVNIDGEKMSKSLGNALNLRALFRQIHPETLRFFLLSSHYKSPINFSDSALKDAHAGLTRLYHALKAVGVYWENKTSLTGEAFSATVFTENLWQHPSATRFRQAMDDDFNTPKAISVLFELASSVHKAIAYGDHALAKTEAAILHSLASVLNVAQLPPNDFLQAPLDANAISEDEILAQIHARATAKAAKDYVQADAIRQRLRTQGVELEDGRTGTTWRRI